METADKESQKDSENKRFLNEIFSKSAIAAGLVFVGGKVMLERRDNDAQIES